MTENEANAKFAEPIPRCCIENEQRGSRQRDTTLPDVINFSDHEMDSTGPGSAISRPAAIPPTVFASRLYTEAVVAADAVSKRYCVAVVDRLGIWLLPSSSSSSNAAARGRGTALGLTDGGDEADVTPASVVALPFRYMTCAPSVEGGVTLFGPAFAGIAACVTLRVRKRWESEASGEETAPCPRPHGRGRGGGPPPPPATHWT
jgi:hypothetical protein